jgi:hypothetical protein
MVKISTPHALLQPNVRGAAIGPDLNYIERLDVHELCRVGFERGVCMSRAGLRRGGRGHVTCSGSSLNKNNTKTKYCNGSR